MTDTETNTAVEEKPVEKAIIAPINLPSFIKKSRIKELINANLPEDKRIASDRRVHLSVIQNRQVISVELENQKGAFRIMGVGSNYDQAIRAVVFNTMNPEVFQRAVQLHRDTQQQFGSARNQNEKTENKE